jgi:hypothetical protein
MDTRSMHRNRPFSILADDSRAVEVLRSFYGFSEETAKELIQELADTTSLEVLAGLFRPSSNAASAKKGRGQSVLAARVHGSVGAAHPPHGA